MLETPSISGSSYASQIVNMANVCVAGGIGRSHAGVYTGTTSIGTPITTTSIASGLAYQDEAEIQRRTSELQKMKNINKLANAVKEAQMVQKLRIVQVFIADPDDNLSLDKRMIYKGEPKLTDSTDQELFFEVDIKVLLDRHNDERIKHVNKKVKERVEHLEPVKIRELKMVVVTIAEF